MSIATDVSRIKGNITAALAAIADKGVTVPDGSTSDALAELIASIEAGGGGGNFDFSHLGDVNFVKSGSFTLAKNGQSIFVEDNDFVEITPKLYILYTESVLTITNKYLPLAIIQANISDDTGFVLGVWSKDLKSFSTTSTPYTKPFNFNATSSVTTDDYYKFNSSHMLCPCSKTSIGFLARASGTRYGDSSYYGYFEAGAIYKYIYMGVKQ